MAMPFCSFIGSGISLIERIFDVALRGALPYCRGDTSLDGPVGRDIFPTELSNGKRTVDQGIGTVHQYHILASEISRG